jgi:CHRD domain-containing protein
MKRRLGLAMAIAILVFASGTAQAQRGVRVFSASLVPEQEVPALASGASGFFIARVNAQQKTIDYALSFDGLSSDVRQAHIHFGQPGVNGGIVIWLCGSTTNPGPAGTQTCPQSGAISGQADAGDVQQVTAQGIAPGDIDDVLAAIRNGVAYANVHSATFPGGEIRGKIVLGSGRR